MREERILRVGWPAPVHALWTIVHLALSTVAVLMVPGLDPFDEYGALLLALFAALCAGNVLFGGILAGRAARLHQGATGRVRLQVAALGSRILAGAELYIGLILLLTLWGNDVEFTAYPRDERNPLRALGAAIDIAAMGRGTWAFLTIGYLAYIVGRNVQVYATIASWFLLPQRVRRIIWLIVDVPLVIAFVLTLWALPFTPELGPDGQALDITLPAIALTIATLFAIRAFARLLPPALDAMERVHFQALVGARMLRAKKSGFLTLIGLLSILAVSFSSCMLTTTLSVMGGFQNDLQRKILGNNAHVVIDRAYGTFEGADPLLERVRGLEGVVGASPYVAGEVMITSASNLGGAMLRGIDPTTIGTVTDLPRNMRHGRLEYLTDPEQLLHLSADEMTGSILGGAARPPPPDAPPIDAAGDAGAPDAGLRLALPGARGDAPVPEASRSLMRDIDRMLGELPPLPGEEASGDAFGSIEDHAIVRDSLRDDGFLRGIPPLQSPREVLPGLIVGQELARSLRLHVGDEVNVVSPVGDLGPAGPIPRSRPFRVAGIFYSGMYEYDMKVVYTDLATAQRFLSTGGAVTGIEVKVDDWERAERSAAAIVSAIARPELRVRSWQEVNRNLFGALEIEKLAMFITLGIAILVASFCIIGTLVLMVQEKGKEVGILKAMGAEDRQIVGMFMLQGLLIGVLGAGSGLGLGWVVCFAFEHFGLIPLDPQVYYIDRLPIHTEPADFVAVGIAAVIVCLLATIYPAILGSRLKPVDALRFS
jgi:lipoprotein-releasing system permease protein